MSFNCVPIGLNKSALKFDSIDMLSERLILRCLNQKDIESILKYANNLKIADMMNGSIPHPYSIDLAKQWVAKHQADSIDSNAISWAIAKKDDDILIGSIQLKLDDNKKSANLSYWLGDPYWNKGYINEAAKQIIKFGFEQLNLEHIEAESYERNSASKAVLKKLGFEYQESSKKIEKLHQREELFEKHILSRQFYENHFYK